jgi:hypothetical protein
MYTQCSGSSCYNHRGELYKKYSMLCELYGITPDLIDWSSFDHSLSPNELYTEVEEHIKTLSPINVYIENPSLSYINSLEEENKAYYADLEKKRAQRIINKNLQRRAADKHHEYYFDGYRYHAASMNHLEIWPERKPKKKRIPIAKQLNPFYRRDLKIYHKPRIPGIRMTNHDFVLLDFNGNLPGLAI